MKMDLINPYMVKIIIAARKEDSIRAISQRINVSYGWTYKWVQALEKVGVFKLGKKKVYINEGNEFYKKTIEYIRDVFSNNVSFYYDILNLLGIQYCFTKTDAVFMWTKGGYNIARYKDHYPVIIKVRKEDKKVFENDYKKLHLSTKKRKGVFYTVDYVDQINVEYIDDMPVDSLKETIGFMEKNKYNFEPALEMINKMYKRDVKTKSKKITTMTDVTKKDRTFWEAIKKIKLKIRFVGSTAAVIWTHGGFITGDFADRVYYVEVQENDCKKLKALLEKCNVCYTENKITKERPIVKIISKKAIKVEKREGLPVMPLKELVSWCKNLGMDSVLEQLNELYSLGLKTKYAEINTNI